ncbi:MAG TPA: o-succinylbenzoate synthase [Vicinamibacteria bacterium]|nr:o-succinylbenzoate synthase [Vicinamibacteria bacterium]
MRIESITIHEVKLDLKHFFETSFSRVTYQRFLLLEVVVDGVTGVSECIADEAPSYSYETVKTSLHAIEDFIAPVVLKSEYQHPDELLPSLRHIRGHNMAKAAVEMGFWEAYARMRGEPLGIVLGGERTEIASGVSIGIQDSVGKLLEKIATEIGDGYRRIKIKPGWDVAVVRQVRERFPDTPLMVDANSAYTLDDLPLFQELDAFDLMMVEQPLHYEDMWNHATLQKKIRTPVCLDESIHSLGDARSAIEMGACRIINIKAGRVGGLSASRDIQRLAGERGIPVWCGGMLESGIGRAHNVHLSTLANFTLPGDVADSKRYFVEELIEPRVEVRPDGTIEVPRGPGIGYQVLWDKVEKHRVSRRILNR